MRPFSLAADTYGKDKKEESAMAVLANGKITVGNATEKRSYFADSGR